MRLPKKYFLPRIIAKKVFFNKYVFTANLPPPLITKKFRFFQKNPLFGRKMRFEKLYHFIRVLKQNYDFSHFRKCSDFFKQNAEFWFWKCVCRKLYHLSRIVRQTCYNLVEKKFKVKYWKFCTIFKFHAVGEFT